jgi:hypothetical protein
MTTKEVANRLVKLCREGKNTDAINELYSDNIVSLEPKGAREERTEGKDKVLAGTLNWLSTVEEFHSSSVSDPVVSGNFFACTMEYDTTMKDIGRMKMDEVCVFEVKDGKIVFEQFFYNIAN